MKSFYYCLLFISPLLLLASLNAHAQSNFTDSYTQNFSEFAFSTGTEVTTFGNDTEWAFDGSDLEYEGNWGSGNTGGFRGNDNVMGYQHSSSTGTLTATLTLVNSTSEPINSLDISYAGLVERAGQGRSPEWTVEVNGTEIPNLFYSTVDEVDKNLSATVSDLDIQPDESFTISWSSDRGEPSGASKQIGLSDVRIEQFTAQAEPTINVIVDNEDQDPGSEISFPFTDVQETSTKTVTLRNVGEDTLNISDISLSGSNTFEASAPAATSLGLNETTTFDLSFTPDSEGTFSGEVTISSNAANKPEFTLSLAGETFPTPDIIPISEAREVPFGTRVTVTGRVTVANQFGGPAYFEDGTAGIAAFWEPFHTEVAIGDSIIITGPVTEFNPIGGTPGDFLRQIGATETDDNITFEILPVEPEPVEPTPVTLQELNTGNFEGQLVIIENTEINFSGNFQANTNYTIDDGTATAEMRIDNNTNLVGVEAPGGTVNIIGAAGEFDGIDQLLPRFADDLGADPVSLPGDDVPMDKTFDVVTWNIEWFGSSSNGPTDVALQLENAKTVITNVDADIYAFQEISDPSQFSNLVSELDAYGGFEADFSQQQKTAFLFKRSTIDSLDSDLISQGMNSFDWANGRLPLMFRFRADINGDQREIYAYNIHAKAGADADSYQRRVNASSQLKNFVSQNNRDDATIVLGDHNDDVTESIFEGRVSPYQNFVDDDDYLVITKSLSEEGATSLSDRSMLDHITINNVLRPDYFEGTERVVNPFFIGSFLSTTSDHFPVMTRFQFSESTSVDEEFASELPNRVELKDNYPNPFNPTTQIEFALPASQQVTLDVYNIMGQKVATLMNNQAVSAGTHTVTFDASRLSSGVYLYRLGMANGQQITRKMMLVK